MESKWVIIGFTCIIIATFILKLERILSGKKRWPWSITINDGFADASAAAAKLDVAAYLAALDEYDGFFKAQGFKTCKNSATASRYCATYGGVIGPSYTYAPPRFDGDADFAARIATFNASYGITEQPLTIGALPRPSVKDFGGIAENDKKFTTGILCTLYCARPANFSAGLSTASTLERSLASITTLSVRGADTLSPTYTTILTVGGESYKFRKVFVDMTGENPQKYTDTLGVRKEFEQGMELFVTTRDAPNTRAFRNIAGTAWEGTAVGDLLKMMVEVRTQEDLNGRLAYAPGAAGATGGAAGGVAGAAGAAATIQGQIAIPAVTYFEDAWMRNKALFDRMYKSIENPAAAVKSYYQSTRIAQGDSYEKTVLRFAELDKRILAAATVNGVVSSEKLRRSDGVTYKFEVPYPYDPQLQIFTADVEEPSLPAIDLKCFKPTTGLQKIKQYFTNRPYEDIRTSNTEIFGKIRTNLCASYGYVSQESLERCGCDGCCIPIAYKQAQRSAKAVPVADDTTTALLTEGVDDCIRFNGIKPFRVAQRTIGQPACEGWENMGDSVAGAYASMTDDIKSTAAKGWRMFAARTPLIMGFTGSGAVASGAGCELPPGALKRAPMNVVKC